MNRRQAWRRAAAATAAAALVLLNGCAFDWDLFRPKPPAPPTPPSTTDYSAEFEDGWGYRCLSDRLQKMYAAVYAAVRECDTDNRITIGGGNAEATDYLGLKITLPIAMTDSAEARRLFNAFTGDNPQFFFLGNTYSYEGYRLNGKDYYDTFCLTLTMEADERKTAAAALETEIDEVLSIVPEGASAYETELALHDALLTRVSYDNDTAQNENPATYRPAAFSAYGALVEGSAVCEGYSRAMQLLLHRAGIPCTLASGSSMDDASHMWNVVEIDERAYHLDVTWNDSDDRINHTFFNLTTEDIARSHQLDDDNLGVDTCTATEANYYLREERFVDTYDRSLIAEAIARQVLDGEERVELQFAPDKFANAQLFVSNPRRVAQYMAPFLNGETMWEYTCIANETYHTLTFYRKAE